MIDSKTLKGQITAVKYPTEQMKALQEKQSLALQHQQSQCQMLMKQLQSQMEAEMRMKSGYFYCSKHFSLFFKHLQKIASFCHLFLDF